MEKRRVLLISQPNLLGESLEHILNSLEDVQVIGSWQPDEQLLLHCIEQPPDLVIITGDQQGELSTSQLITQLLDSLPNLTVIRIKQESKYLLVYTSHTIQARVTDLVEAIHRLPISSGNTHTFQLRTWR